MKKSNLFIWAYIIFLFICIFVQSVAPFILWKSLVLAVIVSSWIFAIADVAFFYADTEKSRCDAYEKMCHDLKKIIHEELRILHSYRNMTSQKIDQDRKDDETSIDEQIDCALSVEKSSIDLENYIAQKRMKIKKAEVVGAVLYIIGFVLFLCCVVFSPVLGSNLQDTLTVASFAMVLSTQLSREKVLVEQKERTIKNEKQIEIAEAALNLVKKSYLFNSDSNDS